METFGPLNMAGFQFLNELGRRISQESDDSRESYLSSDNKDNTDIVTKI